MARIWDQAPHNAFTDLIRFRNRWFCTFREGAGHVSPDGAARVIVSRDGRNWQSAARLESPSADVRDPKLALAPGGRLMLTAAAAGGGHHQTLAWFSSDGRKWSGPAPIGEPDMWLWRVVWHKGTAYGVGYSTKGRNLVRLYRSQDGVKFETLVESLFDRGYPNEAALCFLPNDTALCLLRRDGAQPSAQLGSARPPYTQWSWRDLGLRIGGPQLLRVPGGRFLAAGRFYDGGVRTALAWLDPEAGSLTEFQPLPSGGDTSYPGLVWREGRLWVSYYSSHEGKTAIYLARVRPAD